MRQNEAAKRLGISPTELSRIENDSKEPSTDLLKKAAEQFGVPVDFFDLTDRIYGAPVSVHPMWRKKADVTTGEMDSVIAELNIRTMHLRRLLQATELNPVRTIPQLDIEQYGSPAKIAALLRAHWMMQAGPIHNLTEILEEAGIVIVHSRMGGSSISGVTFRVPGLPPLIVLNSDQSADRMRFTLSHELGHIVMHEFPTPTMEQEANEFASTFLVPTKDVAPHFGPGRVDLPKLAALKRVWKVSMASLVFAADRAGKITPSQKNYLWQQFSMAGIRIAEPPELDFPPERPSLVSTLLRAHTENLGYTLAELSKLLVMTEVELPEFYDMTELLGTRPDRPKGLRIVK